MCFKKWFRPPIVPINPVERRLLTFGKNKYGGQNLQGCWNDSLNLSKELLLLYPDFDVRKFRDGEVTVNRYISEVENAISLLNPGATVLVMADSCFSGTITRFPGMGLIEKNHPTRNRFYDQGLPQRKTVNKKIFRNSGDLRWIVMSGCGEHQTSADAYIGGQYVGAFTYFAIIALEKGMTYKQWYDRIREYLPSAYFSQSPTLEGPDELLNRKVFEDETLVIHNSSHGTYTYDIDGDENDGQDEALYFDKILIDDKIGQILSKIP